MISGWIPNYDLLDLDLDTCADNLPSGMRKDLQQAHQLAAEKHDLEFYKQVLKDFQENQVAEMEAKAAAKLAKTASKSKKKAKANTDEENEDVDMVDVGGEDGGEEETSSKPKSSKKRKAGTDADEATSVRLPFRN